MNLSRKDILYRTQYCKKQYSNKELISFFRIGYEKFHNILYFLNEKNNNKYYYGYEKSCHDKTNPILWEAGHTLFFLEKYCIWNTIDTHSIDEDFNSDTFDRHNITFKRRFEKTLPSYDKILIYYDSIQLKIKEYLETHQLTNSKYYIFWFCLSYLFKQLEKLLCYNQLIYYNKKPSMLKLVINKENYTNNTLTYVEIYRDTFYQGYEKKTIISSILSFKPSFVEFPFDNEKPCFKIDLNSFSVSTTLVTHFLYLQFIENDGYKNKTLWNPNGWVWIQENNITHPLYWEKKNETWYTKYFGEIINICDIYNYPIIHISWYEADAFCRWCNGRLLTETEWEYLAKEGNGCLDHCNLNYNKDWICSINECNEANLFGIEQLFGNCWEWCNDCFKPYDNFIPDPLYSECSYPYFGENKICKGGSWATHTISPSFRRSRPPHSRYGYIGFRVAKTI